MNPAMVANLWRQALKVIAVAEKVLPVDRNSAVSRAYYAAFYAVSARFARDGKLFSRHSAIEAAVHRDLVKPGLWPVELGARFSRLFALRLKGDYSYDEEITSGDAASAISFAWDIIRALSQEDPANFPLSD